MAKIKLKGNGIHTSGELPKVGEFAPDFTLTGKELEDVHLKAFRGKKVVLNIFPSIDTPVCAVSVRQFNSAVDQYENAVVICISRDLPFAHARFCGAEGLDNVITGSEMKRLDFGDKYGVRMVDGPLEGLLARAVIVVDEEGKVIYNQLVGEIAQEPDYDEVLNVVNPDAANKAARADVCIQTETAEHSRMDQDSEPCDDGRAG